MLTAKEMIKYLKCTLLGHRLTSLSEVMSYDTEKINAWTNEKYGAPINGLQADKMLDALNALSAIKCSRCDKILMT